MKKEFPTTVAQDAVLSRLGLLGEVKGYESAKALLNELGLEAWTEGRGAARKIVVKIVDREYGAFNSYGEGETWELAIRKVDLTPISEWIVNPEHPRAPKPEPEPPTPIEEPKAEPAKAASNWQYFPFDGYYQAEIKDGQRVRCNKDDFSSIAAECEEAGIELTPERAIAENWPGFYIVTPGWGGKREGAGRPVTSDKVTTIKVRKVVDKLYSRYGGDTKMARVRDGVCIRAWVNAQTYGTVSTVDGRPWWWEGKTEQELKDAGFTYHNTDVLFFGIKSGKEYQQMDDGSWERMEDEGPVPVRGQVEIIEQ